MSQIADSVKAHLHIRLAKNRTVQFLHRDLLGVEIIAHCDFKK